MAAHARSSASGLTGFVIGIVFVIVVAMGLMLWSGGGREEPLRSAEITVPTPDLPPPPDLVPDAGK